MSGQERLARRYPDLLTPDRMKEGVAYDASYVRSMRSDVRPTSSEPRVVEEWGYVEVSRWIEGVPYIRTGRNPYFSFAPVMQERFRKVALLDGSLVEFPGSEGTQPTNGLTLQPQLSFDVPVKRVEERERSRPEQHPVPERRAVEDLHGYDERPEPLEAQCVTDFLRALGEYRVWAGEPSLRDMRDGCKGRVSHTTLGNALKGEALPKLAVVQALIEGCGGRDEDVQRWTTAWRRLRKKQADGANEGTGPPTLHFVRGSIGA